MKKYVVRYYYCHHRGGKNGSFYIYPKLYHGLVDEKTYNELKKTDTFMCSSKYEGVKESILRCYIANMGPATKEDLEKHKDIKRLRILPDLKGQREALNTFIQQKFGIA